MGIEQEPLDVLKDGVASVGKAGMRVATSAKKTGVGIIRTILISALCLFLGFGVGVYFMKVGNLPFLAPAAESEPAEEEPFAIVEEEVTVTSQDIEMILEPASELVTSVYHYRNASSVQEVKKIAQFDVPGTLSRAVFTYSGTVKVGFKLSDLTIEVDESTKTITITLPPFDIVSSEIDLDSFEFVIEDQSFFNPINLSNYTSAINKLKQDANAQARNDADFMAQARANAQTVLESFLRSAGIEEEYEIVFVFRGQM